MLEDRGVDLEGPRHAPLNTLGDVPPHSRTSCMKVRSVNDQTNVDFYQVVRVVSEKTVQVRQIAKKIEETGFMSRKAMPLKDQFLKDTPAVSRRAMGERAQKVDRDHGASKWDGQPVSCSWGH